ncbi:transcriptional regulator, LacI family [Beutenbergia cavernae DSM 12333]|uniref:Transcriptional regulator, LacI family n=1 Tax=Beutenbergia cavernae (strain ATCC BAA-8 / DSM 12333 / CCUG 43141 / JCM 11478 / NBRC 16432 / NCIMB 13614 / HKI 0122) TaxID=471853 RepID=C5BZK2_BEUC1|nr:LacI family DNA-binding transcriptional regulator [Beutenbergia cavernae]ACQ79174.1 transcriptional regulator, LacI family [Beutenbergia cavernae DSM 12333]
MAAKKNVTLSDVAAVAGVSLSTASKALNGGGRISAETRARIEEAARRLDFRPNALAQSFALGRSRTVAILTDRAESTFARPVIIAAATYLGSHEQAVLLYDARMGRHDIAESIRQLNARRIDGVVVIGDGLSHRTRSVTSEFAVPVSYAFTLSDDPTDTMFVPDNVGIGRLAGEHLVDRGRRRIACITAGSDDIAALLRLDGLREALDAAGLEQAGETLHGTWVEQWGREAAERMLAEGRDIDAVFCGNDHIARGVEDVLTRAGRRVPEDVALVGVDNWEGLIVDQSTAARHLTTIDVGLAGMGEAAAAHVVAGDLAPGQRRQRPTLFVGRSTAS